MEPAEEKGQSTHNGPWSPGNRAQWGMPPSWGAVTSWSLTGWETPE